MTKDRKREIACMMLVDMSADGLDIQGYALELRSAFAFGTDQIFNNVCHKIGKLYKETDNAN